VSEEINVHDHPMVKRRCLVCGRLAWGAHFPKDKTKFRLGHVEVE